MVTYYRHVNRLDDTGLTYNNRQVIESSNQGPV
jgi:hypothetical protein